MDLLSRYSRQTYLIYLEALFAALAANGLAINLAKSVFTVPTLEILGHNISPVGLPHGWTHHRS